MTGRWKPSPDSPTFIHNCRGYHQTTATRIDGTTTSHGDLSDISVSHRDNRIAAGFQRHLQGNRAGQKTLFTKH